MLRLLKALCAQWLGACFFYYYLGTKTPYYGKQYVYQMLQDEENTSLIKRVLFAYVINDFRLYRDRLCNDYQFYQKHKGRDTVSRKTVGDSLKSYGKLVYEDGGETLEEQQRGLILSVLEPFVKQSDKKLKVAEVGADNDDIIAHLAQTYPLHTYYGIDFSTESAETLHGNTPNLELFEGYALDFMKEKKIKPDIFFGSSTFMFFAPNELKLYLKTLKENGCTDIFISEPTWAEHKPSEKLEAYSCHLEDIVWFHNYFGYLKDAGYKVESFKGFDYTHPHSQREDIFQVIFHAKAV